MAHRFIYSGMTKPRRNLPRSLHGDIVSCVGQQMSNESALICNSPTESIQLAIARNVRAHVARRVRDSKIRLRPTSARS